MQHNAIAAQVRSARSWWSWGEPGGGRNAAVGASMTRLIRALLLTVAWMLTATAAHAYLASAYFIHGKGAADLADPGVVYDYWGVGEFINQAKGCVNMPTGYAHYDGTRGLASAWNVYDCGCGVTSTIGCANTYVPYPDGLCGYGVPNAQPTYHLLRQGVGEQIYQFLQDTGTTELYVVAHSMGGEVIRTYLSRTDFYDICFGGATAPPKPQCLTLRDHQLAVNRAISTIFSVHSPHLGSEAATMATALSGTWYAGWIVTWLNPIDKSTRDLMLSNMANENASHLRGTAGRPWPTLTARGESLRVPRWISLGSALSPSQNLEDNAHAEDFELSGCAEFLNGTRYPFAGNVSDGLVAWNSQIAVYTTAFQDQWRFQGQHDTAAVAAGGSGYVGNNHWHAKEGGGGRWRPLQWNQAAPAPQTCCTYPYCSSTYGCYGPPTSGWDGVNAYVCPDPICKRNQTRGYPLGGDEAFTISAFIQARTAQVCGPQLNEIAIDSGRRYPIVNGGTGGHWVGTQWVCYPGFICVPPSVIGYAPLYDYYSPNSGLQICNAGC